MALLKVILILPPSSWFFPVRFGIEWSQLDCVFPRIKIMSPLFSGNLITPVFIAELSP